MSSVVDVTLDKDLVNRAADAELPAEITDPHGYIRDANVHITSVLHRSRALPQNLQWNVLTPEAFTERIKGLTSIQKLGLFYMDQSHQAYVCAALSAWKAESMLRSAIRSLNVGELVAPALLSRALLEHATSTLVRLYDVARFFKFVGESERPVEPDDEIEKKLLYAIWGTRIGTSSELAKGVRLWSHSPYESGEVIVLKNVIGDFKKIADQAPEGQIAYRVYEWSCDIVHPATQGLRLFWGSQIERTPGHESYALERSAAQDQSFTHAIVLWAIGYASVTLASTLDAVIHSVTAAQSRLQPVYGVKLGG